MTHSPTSSPDSSFANILDEGVIMDWFSNYGKYILYGIAAFVLLLAVVFAWTTSRDGQAEANYIKAANDYAYVTKSAVVSDPDMMQKTEADLAVLMSKYPELHAAYDGNLAQTYLERGQISEAKPLAEATLARTASNNLIYYRDYAQTSLLMSEGNIQEALSKALALQQMMIDSIRSEQPNQERGFGDELFALNLLRIGMLQQQLGDHAGELLTWQQWKQYAGLGKGAPEIKVNAQAFKLVIQQLAIGSLALPDYINHREQILLNLK